MPLHIAFLWHMHQPDYVDPATKTPLLPWVRLHASKGYLDMIAMAERFPHLRLTFNLTPVLVRQIEEQARGEMHDLWADWAFASAATLDRPMKLMLLEHFFSAPVDTMILPYPRYAELWRRRGPRFRADVSDAALSGWSEADWRDLQVWQNLAWFGYTACALYPAIVELKKKERNFTEEDKQILLQCQQDILRNVLARYRCLAEENHVELTTTPFYHPILPLLVDTEIARRSMPRAMLPPRFACPEDARGQLSRAIAYHEKTFARRPRGIWPAEGSVCPEILSMLVEQKIEWFATDQEILFRSLDGSPGRAGLFQPYECQTDSGRLNAIFRDRELSDFIGFMASRNPASMACDVVLSKLQQRGEESRAEGQNDPLVAIILDGENAWSNFPDGGQAFLRELYARLTSTTDFVTTTVSGYLASHPPQRRLKKLHSGSWINADFDIWIGDTEENWAWELLGQARQFWQDKVSHGAVSADQAAIALESLYAAEGSDWFWWYGPDFTSDQDLLLDRLFRGHLQHVYRVLGANPPAALNVPIKHIETTEIRQLLPRGYINPVIDGYVTSFYEWQEAGRFVVGRSDEATMARGERKISAIYFGFSPDQLFLRVDLADPELDYPNVSLSFRFLKPHNLIVRLGEIRKNQALKPQVTQLDNADSSRETKQLVIAAAAKVIEIAVPFALLGFEPDTEAEFSLQVFEGELEVERYPFHGQIKFRVPGPDSLGQDWSA